MPRCKAWTRLGTYQLRRFITGFLERCAALYVALTEPPVIPQVRSHRDDDTGLPARCQADASSVKALRPPRLRLPPALPQCPCQFFCPRLAPVPPALPQLMRQSCSALLPLCPGPVNSQKQPSSQKRFKRPPPGRHSPPRPPAPTYTLD